MTGPRLASVRVEGAIVRLRETRASDAPTAFDLMRGRDEILDWLIYDGPTEVRELEEWYGHWRLDAADGANYNFTIEDLAKGTFLGTMSLRFEGHAGQGDIGYWIRSDAWGLGVATEAVRLADWIGFRHPQSMLHYATVFVGNDASARVLEKNGYLEDPAGASKVPKHGRLVERRFFSIARRAWTARVGEWQPSFEAIELD